MKFFKFKKFTIGPVEMGLALVAVIVAGVIGYQFADIKNQSQDTLANTEQVAEADKESEAVQTQEPSKEVKVPKQEKPEAQQPTPETKPEYDEPDQTDKPSKISITASADQISGSQVKATASIGQNLSGTCHFKFIKDNYSKIYKKITFSSDDSCSTTFSTSEFKPGGKWSFNVWFVSSDKQLQGWHSSSVNIR